MQFNWLLSEAEPDGERPRPKSSDVIHERNLRNAVWQQFCSGQHKHVQSLPCFEDYINASGICCAVVAVVAVFKKASWGWRHERMRFISTFKSKPLSRGHARGSGSRRWCSHHGTRSRRWNKPSIKRDKNGSFVGGSGLNCQQWGSVFLF